MKPVWICAGILVPMFWVVPQAFADNSGLVRFQGRLSNITCGVDVFDWGTERSASTEMSVYGQPMSVATIPLPKVPTSSLSEPGKTAGEVKFNLRLIRCEPVLPGGVKAYFTSNPFTDTRSGNLINGGTAQNVQVQLLYGGNNWQPVAIGDNSQIENGKFYTSSRTDLVYVPDPTMNSGRAGGNVYVLPYGARYYATGQATPGTVNTIATFNIIYQ
ncbi:fimbrial protein [Edwardsiella tarda]|uniref:fimbrial protein n=1 Tax=Edwardsiella tarda TaxID=636 RepID=UPI003A89ED0E